MQHGWRHIKLCLFFKSDNVNHVRNTIAYYTEPLMDLTVDEHTRISAEHSFGRIILSVITS